MGNFQYEWWTVDVKEATGKITWEVKAKSKENAIKQIKKMEKAHNEEVQRVRPKNFNLGRVVLRHSLFLMQKCCKI